jgi:hypothetical protein
VSDGITHTSATAAKTTPPRWNDTRVPDFIIPTSCDGHLDVTPARSEQPTENSSRGEKGRTPVVS